MAQSNQYRFEQFFATRRLLGFTPCPGGDSLLFITDISGQFNLWRVASAGGWPEQLTLFEKESVRNATVSADGRRIAFGADPDGNEQYQIYLMDAHGGWPEQLTHELDVQHTNFEFSPDGRSLAYSANGPNRQDIHIYLRDLQSAEVRELCGGGGLYYFGGFSPDGRYVLAVQVFGNTDFRLQLVDVQSGERRLLTPPGDRDAVSIPAFWQKDGSGFFFRTNMNREFVGLAHYDLQTDEWEYVLTPDWDVEAAERSDDGAWLAYVVNEAGNSVLYLRELASMAELPLPQIPRGVITSIDFAGQDSQRRLFVQMSNYKQMGAVYVLDVQGQAFCQVTQSMLGNLPDEAFVEPDPVQITSFDGLPVPAWLYRPRGAGAGERLPAVLAVHGGPEAQERPGYVYGGLFQYLLSQGIAVLAPNIRGSTGFGLDYQMRIHRDWGGAELKDLEACAQYLQRQDWIDPDRLGVWGGSFGGFATLSAVSRLPGYWACGCDFCGPSNLVTFARSVPPHWRAMMKKWVGDPDEDQAMLLERSPITYVDEIRAPLMVVQGANDPRVVKAESDQMVERLRALGRTVEYLVFADEGHGFAKRSNQLKGYKAMADFLVRHLKPEAGRTPDPAACPPG